MLLLLWLQWLLLLWLWLLMPTKQMSSAWDAGHDMLMLLMLLVVVHLMLRLMVMGRWTLGLLRFVIPAWCSSSSEVQDVAVAPEMVSVTLGNTHCLLLCLQFSKSTKTFFVFLSTAGLILSLRLLLLSEVLLDGQTLLRLRCIVK